MSTGSPISEQSHNMPLEGDDTSFSFMLSQGYDGNNLYQHHQLLSPTASPPSCQNDGQDDEEPYKMDMFSSHNFEFGCDLPSPCSPTFGSFQVDDQSTLESTSSSGIESDIKALRSSTSALLSSTRPCLKPLDLNASQLNTNSDPYLDSSPLTAMSMVTSDSPSPTRPSSPSLSDPSEPSSPSYDDVMAPVVACANCKRSHIKCDHGRPCQNCLKHPSKVGNCHDAVPKQRGRPKGGSSKTISEPLPIRLQGHPGFQPFSGGPFLHLHGQPEQPSSHLYGRQRAMSIPHLSMQQQEMLLQEQHHPQYHQHGSAVEYHQAGHLVQWGSRAPGVPEMQAIATSVGPQSQSQLMASYGGSSLDPFELHQLQQHRQQVQQHLQQPQKAADSREIGMQRSMSEQFGPHRAPLRHFHSEHHQLLHLQQQQQQQQQRQRLHPRHSLTLMIPSTVDGRLVSTSAAASPATGSFPISPSMLPPTPISPAHPLQSPTQPYHHRHALHPIHISHPPHSPISHGPVPQGHDDTHTMALLLQQEQEIKQGLERYEQHGYQMQQELAHINLQKLKLQEQQALERLSHLQQLALQQEQQGRIRYHRRTSLQSGMSSLPLSGSSGPLPSVHDEEMVDVDA
ncbi:hypothetical protein BGX27_009395 [Mortierella sp. AM989]|nr:hypothetical protein BGX27_009395 [Mortierella sp. AM989]